MKWTQFVQAAGQAALAITLMTRLPAFANTAGSSATDSIITPGFGTLGTIFEWLRLLFS